MKTAGNLVAVVVELAASVQFGQCDFRGASLGFVLVVPLDCRGNAATVVDYGDRVVGVDRDLDLRGVAGQGFVD